MDNIPERPLILAIETSSRTGSVALATGPFLLEETRFSAPMRHSAEILPAIDALLQRHNHPASDLRQVHLAIGPGSFTGLRIAVTVAKAMHLATAARVVAVDSLVVLAANASEPIEGLPDRIATLFDAKRGQFYAAVYERTTIPANPQPDRAGYRIPAPDGQTWRKIVPDRLMTSTEIAETSSDDGRLGILGDGLLYHQDEFRTDSFSIVPQPYWGPRAANVHRLGYQKSLAARFEEPVALTPFYLRGAQVTLKKRR